MTTERRQRSPKHRELVHCVAKGYVVGAAHDYDLALERAIRDSRRDPSSLDRDVISLLTRRAMTVKGATV